MGHSLFLSVTFAIIRLFFLRRNLPISARKIETELADYDVLIGSGVMPAVLERTNRKLDIFYPYSTGIGFMVLKIFSTDE